MKNKKLVPNIRFKGFIGDWEDSSFDNISNIRRGASPRPIQDKKWFDDKSDVGWIRISDVTEQNGRIRKVEQHLSKAGEEKTLVLESPHLILSIAASVGKPVINYIKTGIHDGFIVFLNPKFNQEYMFQWLEMFRPKWQKYGQPGSQVNINSELVRELKFKIPRLQEQEKIGGFFTKLDNVIELCEEELKNYKEYKKSMLQKMFPKKGKKIPEIRFAGYDDDWEEKKLGEVANYRNGKAHEQNIEKDGEYIVVNSKFVSREGKVKKFSDTQIEPLYKNEIAFVLSDVPNGKAIAKAYYIEQDNKYTLNQRIAGITSKKGNSPLFLFYLMNRHSYFLKFDNGVGQTNLSKEEVLKFKELYPSLPEQEKIGTFFRNLDSIIEKQEEQLENYKNLKKSMLQKMFV